MRQSKWSTLLASLRGRRIAKRFDWLGISYRAVSTSSTMTVTTSSRVAAKRTMM
jgi:hypothetical protein